MQYRQTAAIMVAPGVTYFYFDHIQWTSEANPHENSTDTTPGNCSVDITAISSYHTLPEATLIGCFICSAVTSTL